MTLNGSATYTYNAETELSSAGGVSYTYDGDGTRVKKSNGTLYWGTGGMIESDLSGNLQREFALVNGKRVARRDISSGNYFFYLNDHLDSSRVVTSSTGAIQNDSDYYPYGGERVYSQALTNQNYKFTGKERDSESGLDNYGARHYGSALGRFVQPDPISVSAKHFVNPQKWNKYAYVLNNPLSFTDPDGRAENGAKTIDVFLIMSATDRNTNAAGVREAGPNWNAIVQNAATHGYTVNVTGPINPDHTGVSTLSAVTKSLQNSAATVIVGHGTQGTQDESGKFVTRGISLQGGTININGVIPTNAEGQASGPADPKPSANSATCLLLCNSKDQLANAFNVSAGSTLVVNNGGSDGLTSVGTLEKAAASFVQTFASTNGNVDAATGAAQKVMDQSKVPIDQNGDKLEEIKSDQK